LHNYLLSCPLATLYNFAENSICSGKRRFICPTNCIFSFEKISGRRPKEIVLSTMLNSIGRNYIEWLASMGDALICVSNAQKRLIMQTCGKILWRKFHVVYNPLPEVSYVKIDGEDFGYFGGMSYLKGFEVLRRALTLLKNTSIKVYATNFSHLQAIKLADSLQKLGIVLYGRLERDEHPELYRKIRAVLVPSIVPETWSYVVTEAILRGRIVVASKIGGIPEQARGCKGVILFEPKDFRGLAEKIEYISSLPREKVSDLGAQNRETFLTNFSPEKPLADFSELCNKLVEHST
jgi:glycosyltransferase involved in cell wall biosynthesis